MEGEEAGEGEQSRKEVNCIQSGTVAQWTHLDTTRLPTETARPSYPLYTLPSPCERVSKELDGVGVLVTVYTYEQSRL